VEQRKTAKMRLTHSSEGSYHLPGSWRDSGARCNMVGPTAAIHPAASQWLTARFLPPTGAPQDTPSSHQIRPPSMDIAGPLHAISFLAWET
jgi:hypothetical protein